MLVLTRHSYESILIGNDIKITLLPDHKVGIEAPDDVLILREELVDQSDEERPYLPD